MIPKNRWLPEKYGRKKRPQFFLLAFSLWPCRPVCNSDFTLSLHTLLFIQVWVLWSKDRAGSSYYDVALGAFRSTLRVQLGCWGEHTSLTGIFKAENWTISSLDDPHFDVWRSLIGLFWRLSLTRPVLICECWHVSNGTLFSSESNFDSLCQISARFEREYFLNGKFFRIGKRLFLWRCKRRMELYT